ncbi:hypothetical protein [Nonomuraea sp. NPDC002799]
MPAQAEVQYDTARYAPQDGGAGAAGSPIGSLLGGLIGGGLLGGLLGGGKAKAGAQPGAQMSELERDRASEAQQRAGQGRTPNGAEDTLSGGMPIREVQPILGGFGLGQARLAESLPVLGSARMAQPAASSGSLLPGAGASVAGTSTTATRVMYGTTKGFESLAAETTMAGLTQAARHALPSSASGELAPMVGRVAPVEMAPVVEALPGTTQVASMDELAPLVEDGSGFVEANGTRAVGRYSDVLTALGWSTESLTRKVRGSWARD